MRFQDELERQINNKVGMRWNYEVRWYEFNLTESCSRKFFTEIGAKLYKLYLEHFEGAVAKIYEI